MICQEDTDDIETSYKPSVDVNEDSASSVCREDIRQVFTNEEAQGTEGTVVENIILSLTSDAFQPIIQYNLQRIYINYLI